MRAPAHIREVVRHLADDLEATAIQLGDDELLIREPFTEPPWWWTTAEGDARDVYGAIGAELVQARDWLPPTWWRDKAGEWHRVEGEA